MRHQRQSKATIKHLATEELTTLVEESWDDIFLRWYHIRQNGIGSVVYNVVEHVILDFLRKDTTFETQKLT